jgi:hypothetical protein
MNYQSSSHQSPTPCRSHSFRSMMCAAAFGLVVASASPALASISSSMTLDAVTAAEGYPIVRNYYVAHPTTGYYSIGWDSADLRSGRTVKKGHLGNTTKSAIH